MSNPDVKRRQREILSDMLQEADRLQSRRRRRRLAACALGVSAVLLGVVALNPPSAPRPTEVTEGGDSPKPKPLHPADHVAEALDGPGVQPQGVEPPPALPAPVPSVRKPLLEFVRTDPAAANRYVARNSDRPGRIDLASDEQFLEELAQHDIHAGIVRIENRVLLTSPVMIRGPQAADGNSDGNSDET